METQVILVLLIIIIIAILYYKFIIVKQMEFQYESVKETLYNPMMGFAPAADYIEAVGENTLVYMDITWREWEPIEGVYDVESVIRDNNLEMWRKQGKKVVLRFVCDIPDDTEHLDIPDWLYAITGDGTNYNIDYGKGYSPNYSNKKFIAAHERAIKALGNSFGQDSFVCYVELGSLGHWGEWHVKYDEGILPIPSRDICIEYVEPYIEAFPIANKEMIDYPEEIAQILKNIGYRYGVRKCKVKYNTWTNKIDMDLLFENRGTAPMYFKWPVFIYLLDEEKNLISKFPVNIDLRTLSQNELQKVSINFIGKKTENNVVTVGIGIENPETGKAEVYMDMNSNDVNGIYLLYQY